MSATFSIRTEPVQPTFHSDTGLASYSSGVQYQSTTMHHAMATKPVVVASGTCPICKAGLIQQEFSCCGVCLSIFLFPLGLICCYLMRKTRCSNCGKEF
ncbi:brain protein I3-like isoform X2 [Penaeus japonicus]|uniref:brain protein I3-like isoform X2 n=1 Tax=Penaeus japonicus TaxID=27405 RepID=UPI001C70CD21|nr:brain protein I3-like isoform X2 [Penaeus japonicus]